MNEREIAEIRRRLRPEKNNIGRICGCYVNDNHKIISSFNDMFGMISDNESEEILSVFRKILSGSIDRNLIDISFSNQQVADSNEHRLLSTLRDTKLNNTEAVQTFYDNVIASTDIEGSYLILLANDTYDVINFNSDGESNDSSEIFTYILCAVCPIKNAKPTLGYSLSENKFKNILRDSIVSSPELGFMFPTFDTRRTNIYNALFYTRDISNIHESFIDNMFKSTIPTPANEQTESIASLLNSSISEDCSLELVQSIQSQLIELSDDHKSNKDEDVLKLSSKDIGSLLRCSGINEEKISDFSEKFEESFGINTEITPTNILNIKKFELKTPDVTVKVKPECSDLVQTRIIDGTKYILIRADEDVEVNGVRINISD